MFTAVDVETTGLDDQDRIIELAAVVFRGDGEILDEYATMVDPVTVSANGTREIHGLSDEEVAGAPRAETVLPQLWRLSAGTVLAAHNLEFERRFLVRESERARLPVPAMLALCTLRTARVQLDGRTFRLKPLYKTATGEWPDDDHTALGDARATAAVLCWMLREAPGGLHLESWPPPPPDTRYASVQPGRMSVRPAPVRSNELADFVRHFPRSRLPQPTVPEAGSQYEKLLAAVIADKRVTLAEAAELEACARVGGLTQMQLEDLHRKGFFTVLGDEASIPPAALSPVRRRELLGFARSLGIRDMVGTLAPLVEADQAAARQPAGTGYLKGWRIALDPVDDPGLAHLRDLAAKHDAAIARRLTKTVRFLATTTPGSLAQANAREIGIPVITPQEAERLLDEAVRAADLTAFEDREAEEEREAERAAQDLSWRHTWKRAEDPSAADRPADAESGSYDGTEAWRTGRKAALETGGTPDWLADVGGARGEPVSPTPRPEPRDDLLYGTVRGCRAVPYRNMIRVTFTFVTDDGQDIEVTGTGDDLADVANGDRFTANKGLTDMAGRVPVAAQAEAAKVWDKVNGFEPWKRAQFRSDPKNVQFAAECGWRFDNDDKLRKVSRS